MSSILQGLGQSTSVQRTHSFAPKEERNKEGRTQGATPPNRDSYVPSNQAAAIMFASEEVEEVDETLFDVMCAEETSAEQVTEELDVDFDEIDIDGDEIDVDGDEIDVDGDEIDVDGDEIDVDEEESEEELEVETNTYNSITVADSSDRTNGYLSSLSDEDRIMLEIAYQGFSTSSYESSSSLFDYLSDSSSGADWLTNDYSSAYDSLIEALANASSSTDTEEVEDVEESETDLEEVEVSEEVEETDLQEELTQELDEETQEESHTETE